MAKSRLGTREKNNSIYLLAKMFELSESRIGN